jgi:WD40 repeat protein
MARVARSLWAVVTASIALSLALAIPAVADAVDFDRDVRPILQKSCSGCHFPEAESLKAKLNLSTADTVLTGGASGPAIVAGNADESLLVRLVEFAEEPHMPPEGKGEPLTPESIAIIKQWINEGAVPTPVSAPSDSPGGPGPVAAPTVENAPVASLAYSPAGTETYLARGSFGRVDVLTIDSATGKATPKFALGGHSEMVRALAFSPDGSLLAAAGGKPGRNGEVKLWDVAAHRLVRTLEGHKDNILGVAFSPDGQRLATCSYDKFVIVWDLQSGEPIHTLSNHVDAVYAVSWSPDGATIASGAGDRTVKIWDAESGMLRATISDSLDNVLTLAFSPDGTQLAGAGADKMIRIWDMNVSDGPVQQSATTSGTLLRSTFAHEGAVLRIAYSPDGATLYSASEDLRIKAWTVETLEEKFSIEAQSDWVTALAVSPDGAYLAAGRYDASSDVYTADTGQPVAGETEVAQVEPATEAAPAGRKKVSSLSVEAVIIEATVPPSISSISPVRWHRGAEVELTVDGKNLDQAEPIVTNDKIAVEVVEREALPMPELKLGEGPRGTGADILDNAQPYRLKLKFAIAEDSPLGAHQLMFRTPIGMTNPTDFTVLQAPDLGEAEPNDILAEPQAIEWPNVVIGQIAQSGDVDRYQITVNARQEIVCALTDTALNPGMRLLDAAGSELATSVAFGATSRDRLGYRAEADGPVVIEVTDVDLRGGLGYRLHIGAFPMVTDVWPLGVHAGEPQPVHVAGFNLPSDTIDVNPPDTVRYGATMPVPVPAVDGNPIGAPSLAVASYAETIESEPNDAIETANPLSFPMTINGHIGGDTDGVDADVYRFTAKKGETIILETAAATLGSPLDSVIEVLDSSGNLLEQGVARCVAETFLTLSPRDSRSAGLRLAVWRDLRLNDYVMFGGEIGRVAKIPDYADEDVVFSAYPNGQRITYFGTTPEHHAVYSKVYKVEVHPPGTTFAPNGMPVYPLYWRNDDGFSTNGDTKGDSRLDFVAPDDGEYLIRVTDATGNGGNQFAYRLMARPPEPDFDVSTGPFRVNVAQGSRVPIDVRVLRRDGFDGDVRVQFHGLPEGIVIEPAVIERGDDLIRLALEAREGAESTPMDARVRLTAESTVNGETVVRESALGPITVSQMQPDLVVNADSRQVALVPGNVSILSVKLDRQNGFESRVPIDVLNLPFGVYVMNTGLNGILVREGEYERSIEIYAEPWVTDVDRTIYVQAQIETQSPLKPVFLGEPIQLRLAEQVAQKAADPDRPPVN